MWTSETEQILSALAGIGYGTDFEVFEGPDGITAWLQSFGGREGTDT
jgi:hypothetical protein